MKILFVLSGNSRESAKPGRSDALPVKNPVHQADTLRTLGHEVDFFFIKGRGLSGYLRSIPLIRRKIRNGGYDVIHAHYSLTAFAVSLAGSHRMVVSLTGSDVMGMSPLLHLTRLFSRLRWARVIVKTRAMKARLRSGKILIIPNGVDTCFFAPADKCEAKKQLGFAGKRIVLFVADPAREEKNYPLAREAVSRLGRDDTVLLPVHGVAHEMMPAYYNAADVLLLTSLWEGSVNSVKEAMACNLPVVSADVGDVRENTQGLAGYYITSFDAAEIADKLAMALDCKSEIRARERLFELRLDSASVAGRLIEMYNSVISQPEGMTKNETESGRYDSG